jgi:hypothetical protein
LAAANCPGTAAYLIAANGLFSRRTGVLGVKYKSYPRKETEKQHPFHNSTPSSKQ